MAEPRQKTHHILLAVNGKNTTLELYDAREWPSVSSNDGEMRVRINGKWHCPLGKYTFLTPEAVGRIVAAVLSGAEPPQPEDAPEYAIGQAVRVFFGECVGSVPLRREVGRIAAPPYRGIDGRWYVAVTTFDGTTAHLCHDVEAMPMPGRRKRR